MTSRPLFWRAVMPALMLAGVAVAQDSADLPLPRWSPAELDTMRGVPDAQAVPESMLWPPGMLDITPPVTLPWYLGEGDSPDAEQPHADVSLFLPPSLVGSRTPAKAAPPGLLKRVVSAEFMGRLAISPPEVHLIDPGKTLLPAFHEDLTRFVESHARDSQIKLYVLLLGPSAMLPKGANLSAIAQGALEKGHGSLLVYPMGDPSHARLFMSRSVCAVASSAELAEALQDARGDAMEGTSGEDQLHRMLVRLSIRLFWLERLLDKPEETIVRAVPVPVPVSSASLPEVSDSGIHIADNAWAFSWRWGIAVLVAMLAAWSVWRWRGYRLRHYEWLLPVPEVAARRFGAPHSASGVSVSYS